MPIHSSLRAIPRALTPSTRQRLASTSTSSSSSSVSSDPSSSGPLPIRAAVLLSRPPLITPLPTPLEDAYHAYQRRIRSALSNPTPTSFYFKAGSLPLRRFQRAAHEADVEAFGPRLAGKTPEVGDLPLEPAPEPLARDHWAKEDEGKGKGEASLERRPDEEVYCLVRKGGKGEWVFPSREVGRGEALDEVVKRGILGVGGEMDGQGMDSWVVTRKPIGVVQGENEQTFFLRAHILAGEPRSSSGSDSGDTYAWLSADEVCERLGSARWAGVRGMFGRRERDDVEAGEGGEGAAAAAEVQELRV